MALTLGKSPMLFTAVGDMPDRSHWCVTAVKCVATGSGQFVLTDGNGGQKIYESPMLNAGEADETHFDGHWWDQLYLAQSPGGTLYVYYK